jgi:hypothetical protein
VICGLNADVTDAVSAVPDESMSVAVPGDVPARHPGPDHVTERFWPVRGVVTCWLVLPYVSLTLPVIVIPPETLVELPHAALVTKHWIPLVTPDVMFVVGLYEVGENDGPPRQRFFAFCELSVQLSQSVAVVLNVPL